MGKALVVRESEDDVISRDVGLPASRMYLGVFLTSAAVLLLEISLTRIFSYTIGYHFTYMTISLAMLGFGAAGAVLASLETFAAVGMRLAQRSSLAAAISVPIMLVVISKVPFYPFQIFKEPVQLIYAVLYYLAATLPFFCAGLTISSTFRNIPLAASRIYFWDLVGAGTGCLVIVATIRGLGAPAAVALAVVLFLLAAAMFLPRGSRFGAAVLVAGALVWIPIGIHVEKVLRFNASKEKWVSKMKVKNFEFSKWSPIFRVDTYTLALEPGSRAFYDGSFYGINNQYLKDMLEYGNIAHDGDACALMIKSDDNLSAYNAFEKSILKVPYLLLETPKALIIGPGGGVDVGVALQNKARSVLAVELDPITVDLVSHRYADFVGHLYDKPQVKVVADEGRSFLRRCNDKFDIIQMTGVDTLAALSSGAYVLAENYLYTTEAYRDFMSHLTPDGILSVAIFDHRYQVQFPRQVARQVSLSIAALKKMGINDPYKHIAVIAATRERAGVAYVIILTKISPFTFSEIRRLKSFTDELSFEAWFLPGAPADNPIASLASSTDEQREEFYRANPLKVAATTDDSPFFFHYYKWATLLKEHPVDTGHTMATGQLILLLILVLSVVFSAALIIFPLFKFQRAGLQTKRKWSYVLYFAGLGVGFIFIEISYVQRFILFLGYPTYSLTVILFSLLTFSGIGSYLSGKLPLAPRKIILVAVVLLALVALGYLKLLPPIFNYFLGSPKELRIAISLLLLFPLGLLLGMFFPTGIRMISEEDRRFVPWAWGVNGCASVIGTVLSIIIAMSHGFSVVTALAVAIYLVGVCAMLVGRKETPSAVAAE